MHKPQLSRSLQPLCEGLPQIDCDRNIFASVSSEFQCWICDQDRVMHYSSSGSKLASRQAWKEPFTVSKDTAILFVEHGMQTAFFSLISCARVAYSVRASPSIFQLRLVMSHVLSCTNPTSKREPSLSSWETKTLMQKETVSNLHHVICITPNRASTEAQKHATHAQQLRRNVQ